MSRPQPLSGRRAPLPPSPLGDELVRARVLDALDERFDVPITTVVAGAGFGKTTALAQAIRANDASPRGIDAWVACEPGDEDAGRLSSAVLSALGVTMRGGDPLDRVLGALAGFAPIDVCVVFDDLHEVSPSSAGERLVVDLLARLPSHAHVVLSSRTPVPAPLERRRAAGQVIDISDEALAFSDDEVAALAAALGGDQASCDDLAGWPSLVRLVLSAPAGATRQFLWEEIVAGLTPAARAGLLALAVLGSGTAEDVAFVADRDVEIGPLVGVVPLLHRDERGAFGAHRLWEDAVQRIFSAAEVQDARRRALQLFVERGETVRLGSAASSWGDAEMFRLACVALVKDSLGVLPTDTAALWLARTPPRAVGTAEPRLLELALQHAQHRRIDQLDADLDALEAAFVGQDDGDARAVVLALGAVAAHARNDLVRLVSLTQRISTLPGVADQPQLQFFVDAVEAGAASLAGDIERTLRIIDAMSFDRVPAQVSEIVVRLHATTLVLAGRATEAIATAASLVESPHAYVRSIPAMLRWLSGDPSDYLALPLDMGPLLDVNPYRLVSAAHGAGVAASLGDHRLAAAVRSQIEAAFRQPMDARDSAIASVALACLMILEHDEDTAAVVLADHVARHPPPDARADARLRRHLAVVYVCAERLRGDWDSGSLGPMHGTARTIARQLIDAREGRLDRGAQLAPPPLILTTLPLAWSVELAVRATAVGVPDAPALVRTLIAWLPGATRDELAWLAVHGDATCRDCAAGLLDDLREVTHEALQIDVLGPLRLRVGGTEISDPALRRARVRTLISLLALRGQLRRDRIADLVWPDLGPESAAQNVRVTLSRLRRMLDATVGGAHTSTIRSVSETIELGRPPLVDCDLAQFRTCVADADRAHRIGDSTAEIASLSRAVELWRGEPFADLAAIDDLAAELEFVNGELLDGCLRLGELLLVGGRFDESLRCAERGRSASPYSERAHRLLIACQLQRQDYAGLESAVRATRAMLDELAVEPSDATLMLLRRAAVRLGASSGSSG